MAVSIMFLTTAVLIYTYLGYPALLWLLARLFPVANRFDDSFTPSVTLIISAYNEETSIEAKIQNALQLDYPPEKLTIMVVSDCSTDRTDQLVQGFKDQGVLLVRPETRRGKTAGLNLALAQVSSEIVLFSDANAMYDQQAVRYLVRHFSNPRTGYVVGHARYQETTQTAAGVSEGGYWSMEVSLKAWESTFSSVVGGDGALYAIRRELYEPLQETDINDFVNPLQIIAKGFRGIFEPAAWCTEKPAGQFSKEFSRKVRIANRSLNGLLRVSETCNPLKFGRFAWQLISHKLLRWFSPYLLCIHFTAALAVGSDQPHAAVASGFVALYGVVALLSLIGWWLDKLGRSNPLFFVPHYVSLMHVASAIGVFLRLQGKVISTWETVRTATAARDSKTALLPLLLLLIMAAALYKLLPAVSYPTDLFGGQQATRAVRL